MAKDVLYDRGNNFIGRVWITPTRNTRDEVAFDETWMQRYSVRVDGSGDPESIKESLFDLFEIHGCGHDYDCCGCVFGGAYSIYPNGNRWVVNCTYARNY